MDPNVISALRQTAAGLAALAEALEAGRIGVPDPPNLTVPDVAKLLACSEDTIRAFVHREGDPVPVCHVGTLLRFRRSEVLEWASRQRPKREPVKPIEMSRPIPAVSGVRRAAKRVSHV